MQRRRVPRKIKEYGKTKISDRLQIQHQDQDQYQKKTQTDYEKEQIIIFSIFQSFRNDRGMKPEQLNSSRSTIFSSPSLSKNSDDLS